MIGGCREQLEALQEALHDIAVEEVSFSEDDAQSFDDRPGYGDVGAAMRKGEARTYWDGDMLVDTFPAEDDADGYAWGACIEQLDDGPRYRMTILRTPAVSHDEIASGLEHGGLYGLLLLAAADGETFHEPSDTLGDTYVAAVAEVETEHVYESEDAVTVGVSRAVIDTMLDGGDRATIDALDVVQIPALNADDEQRIGEYGLDGIRS